MFPQKFMREIVKDVYTKVGDDGPEAGQGQYDLEFSSDGKSSYLYLAQMEQMQEYLNIDLTYHMM